MVRTPLVPARVAADVTAVDGDHPQAEALAFRLPALRATLERHLHFRREQLAELDASLRGHDAGNRPVRDGAEQEPSSPLRQVDALVAAGARRALADIELALLRMRTGRYGRCRSCGVPIPLPVLEAIPKTTICLLCQQREDHAEEGALLGVVTP